MFNRDVGVAHMIKKITQALTVTVIAFIVVIPEQRILQTSLAYNVKKMSERD